MDGVQDQQENKRLIQRVATHIAKAKVIKYWREAALEWLEYRTYQELEEELTSLLRHLNKAQKTALWEHIDEASQCGAYSIKRSREKNLVAQSFAKVVELLEENPRILAPAVILQALEEEGLPTEIELSWLTVLYNESR